MTGDNQSLEARVARLEALELLRQLPSRYAMAIDARDLDALVGCFVPDVEAGRWGTGREALRRFFDLRLRDFYRTIHQICGQTTELVDTETARGTTYCRAEHEGGGRWVVMAICYTDTFARRDGDWFFLKRKERHWYTTDVLSRPGEPAFDDWAGTERKEASLPHAWPSWQEFWQSGRDAERIAELTRHP
jgi:hypothetical protein